MKRAAIYARVSTHNGQNPEMQLEEIRQYCANRGWTIAEEYVDRGISGTREHRPALDRLLGACRRRLVDAVIVYRYDRFARSLRQLVNALEEFPNLRHRLHQSARRSRYVYSEWTAYFRHLCLNR